jgi:hypothetical protein
MDFFFLVGFRRLFRRCVLRRTGVFSQTAITGSWDSGGSTETRVPLRRWRGGFRCKKMLQGICRFTSRHCVLLPRF